MFWRATWLYSSLNWIIILLLLVYEKPPRRKDNFNKINAVANSCHAMHAIQSFNISACVHACRSLPFYLSFDFHINTCHISIIIIALETVTLQPLNHILPVFGCNQPCVKESIIGDRSSVTHRSRLTVNSDYRHCLALIMRSTKTLTHARSIDGSDMSASEHAIPPRGYE